MSQKKVLTVDAYIFHLVLYDNGYPFPRLRGWRTVSKALHRGNELRIRLLDQGQGAACGPSAKGFERIRQRGTSSRLYAVQSLFKYANVDICILYIYICIYIYKYIYI